MIRDLDFMFNLEDNTHILQHNTLWRHTALELLFQREAYWVIHIPASHIMDFLWKSNIQLLIRSD